ncbi:hypothetical protein QYM36_005016 [Artemia franciscana]|uniref:Serine/threonine specific protein phosphatases domain-containing protein n=1 Tax=Artemia franciscana TaxID=6661 RepID=A0AA88I6R1_ARTSF|nr:hypothetical protein QYM36_005016 [Artemia franciscana]
MKYSFDESFLKRVEETFLKDSLLKEKEVLSMLKDAKTLFLKEKNVVRIFSKNVSIFGDIHGQYSYQQKLYLSEYQHVRGDVALVQLGNCLNRGPQNVESFLYAIARKLVYPKNFFFIRGSHESRAMIDKYGAKKEINLKYSEKVFDLIMQCCNALPIAAVVNTRHWCAHGGIPYYTDKPPTIQEIDAEDRIKEPEKMSTTLQNILWSDPVSSGFSTLRTRFEESSRGDGIYDFTAKSAKEFLKKNKLDVIIRGHQFYPEGYKSFKDSHGKTILRNIFSSVNYCGNQGNPGAVWRIIGEYEEGIFYSHTDELEALPPGKTLWDFLLPLVVKNYYYLAKKIVENRHQLVDLLREHDVDKIIHGLGLHSTRALRRLLKSLYQTENGNINSIITQDPLTLFRFFDVDGDNKIFEYDLYESMKLAKCVLPNEWLEEETRHKIIMQAIHTISSRRDLGDENYVDLEDFKRMLKLQGYAD